MSPPINKLPREFIEAFGSYEGTLTPNRDLLGEVEEFYFGKRGTQGTATVSLL